MAMARFSVVGILVKNSGTSLFRKRWTTASMNREVMDAVVHRVHDFAVHGVFELLEIDNKSGADIDVSLHRHFQCVIVAMAIWVITFAEDSLVFLRGEIRVVIIVRGGEFGFAG